MALLLGLVLGCAGPKVSTDEMAAEAAPQMRAPAPEAPMEPPPAAMEGGAMTDEEMPEAAAGEGGDAEGKDDPEAYRFKPSDGVAVTISGIVSPQTVEDIVDERGLISLPYVGQIQAEGRTASELEQVVHDAYVPAYYRFATISVMVPGRNYFIQGEVRAPSRYPLVPGITIMQAIATAGGYTEYAAPKRARLIRDGESRRIDLKDLEKHPEKDIPLKARDVIRVPRAWF